MNDFTKEELEGLMVSLNYLLKCGLSRRLFYVNLQDKIQSMLESYLCKHESQTPSANDSVHMCVKCNEEFVI